MAAKEQGSDPFADARPLGNNLAHLYRGPFEPPMPTAAELGRRLARMRDWLGIPTNEVARRSGLPAQEIETFERSGEISAQSLLTIIHAMSDERGIANALLMPRFESLDEVKAWEKRRLAEEG